MNSDIMVLSKHLAKLQIEVCRLDLLLKQQIDADNVTTDGMPIRSATAAAISHQLLDIKHQRDEIGWALYDAWRNEQ